MSNFIEIIKPDDMHLHLRDNDLLKLLVPLSARQMGKALIMPNLNPPIIFPLQAIEYKKRISSFIPYGVNFKPLMTLYLTDNTTDFIIKEAKKLDIVAFKLYPAGATTNSNFGIKNILKKISLLEKIAQNDLILSIHGEVVDNNIDIFDREAVFIDKILSKIIKEIPDLKIVLEHITTKDAVDFIEDSSDNICATVTAHHLLLNRNDLLSGKINPHNYCLPILKREHHRCSLLKAIIGNKYYKYFLGTDSAPHDIKNKECHCGCAGVFSSPMAIELYTQIFENLGALDKLEKFASINGSKFYGLPINIDKIKLEKKENIIPSSFEINDTKIIPFKANEKIFWKMV